MAIASDLIISSDSHVMEPVDLWKTGVPEKYRDGAPVFPPHQVGEGFQQHAGGWDPNARMKEMEADGLSAEVLYPTLGLDLFAIDDAGLQEACFRAYNDWLIDYCSVNTDRLIGIPAIPVYNIDNGIKELERCNKAGLKGAIIWQAPHPDWTPDEPWPQEVSSYAIDDGARLLLVDPLAVPGEILEQPGESTAFDFSRPA